MAPSLVKARSMLHWAPAIKDYQVIKSAEKSICSSTLKIVEAEARQKSICPAILSDFMFPDRAALTFPAKRRVTAGLSPCFSLYVM